MDKPSRGLQENLITLLCFDDERAALIRNTVELNLFESAYQEIARAAYSYVDQYKRAPKEHIGDLLESVLDGSDSRKAKTFENILFSLHDFQKVIDGEFVIEQLSSFIRQQTLKSAIIRVVDMVQDGDPEKLSEAEQILNEATKTRLQLFDAGSRISDIDKALAFLDAKDPCFPTGISYFDHYGIGPIRKGLNLFVALSGRGKTWWLINLGKHAVVYGYRVLHVTLEMSEERILQRYLQSMFAMAKRSEESVEAEFTLDHMQQLTGLDLIRSKPKLAMDQPDIKKILRQRIGQFGRRLTNRLLVKEFPDGQLTMRQLKTYLDHLEAAEGYVPDLLIVDYADKMNLPADNLRISLGRLTTDLRGLGVERNMAIATASQSHREGLNKRTLDEGSVAEDFTKIGIADSVVTYSQTDEEQLLGLARLFVAKSRDDVGRFQVLITQNYHTGQFVKDSIMMSSPKSLEKYFAEVDDQVGTL